MMTLHAGRGCVCSAGEPSARVTEILPHSATPEAHACLEAEQVRGRVLLRP